MSAIKLLLAAALLMTMPAAHAFERTSKAYNYAKEGVYIKFTHMGRGVCVLQEEFSWPHSEQDRVTMYYSHHNRKDYLWCVEMSEGNNE